MILVADIGTTSVKAALFDRAGSCLAVDSRNLEHLCSDDPVAHEIDPEVWMAAIRSLVPSLSAAASASSSPGARVQAAGTRRIECLVVSGNGPTLIPVDRAGKALHPAITWMDRRAVAEAAEAGRAAGRFLDPTYNLPKALWFRNNKPAIYEKTASFSGCPEFICGRLTGEWRSILPAEGFQPIIWDRASIAALGMDEDKFPAFIKPGQSFGTVSADAAAEFGIPVGIPVVAGGPDFAMSLVGTATTRPGRACDRAGTSEGINLCHAGGFTDDPRLLLMPHIIEPFVNVSGVISTTGRAVSWFRKAIGESEKDYEGFFERICQVPAGADRLVFLPYLSGERAPIWDTSARGVFLGLTLNHGVHHMARAVVESSAFAMRDVIETMESLGGVVSELRVTGNPGRNPVWNQIKADITGKPLVVPRFAQAELLGDLAIGLVALGDYPDTAAAAEKLVVMGRVHEPDPSSRELYEDLFSVFRESYRALKPVFARLASARPAGSKED